MKKRYYSLFYWKAVLFVLKRAAHNGNTHSNYSYSGQTKSDHPLVKRRLKRGMGLAAAQPGLCKLHKRAAEGTGNDRRPLGRHASKNVHCFRYKKRKDKLFDYSKTGVRGFLCITSRK